MGIPIFVSGVVKTPPCPHFPELGRWPRALLQFLCRAARSADTFKDLIFVLDPESPSAPYLKPTATSIKTGLQLSNLFWRAEAVGCLKLAVLLDLYEFICWKTVAILTHTSWCPWAHLYSIYLYTSWFPELGVHALLTPTLDVTYHNLQTRDECLQSTEGMDSPSSEPIMHR